MSPSDSGVILHLCIRIIVRPLVSEPDNDYSPLGVLISICLIFVIALQAMAAWYFLGNEGSPTRHESLAGVAYLSFFATVFWAPGLMLGYKITTRLGNKIVGTVTMILSVFEFCIFVGAVSN